jgi:phage FluMu protein Com
VPQFILMRAVNGDVEVKCPLCEALLATLSKQDERVHVMLHPETKCRWSKVHFRVDRLTGYAEPWPKAQEDVGG